MDWYVTILRVLHISAGVYWVGAGLFMGLILYPTAIRLGADGRKYLMAMHKSRIFVLSMPVVSIVTTVAGLLLYAKVTNNFEAEIMKTTKNWVLSVGIVAGFLAFGHGLFAMSMMDNKFGKLAKQIESQPDGATSEQDAQLATMTEKLSLHAKISAGLAVIAVVFMAGHRYVA